MKDAIFIGAPMAVCSIALNAIGIGLVAYDMTATGCGFILGGFFAFLATGATIRSRP